MSHMVFILTFCAAGGDPDVVTKPRQKPASFNLDEVMRQVSNPGPGQD